MTQAMLHRGPDGAGFFESRAVNLGMRRLKVIDLNTGDQPMNNEDGSVAVIFNGEIYNFLELSQELQRRGHRFSSRSDTEVIVHAFEEWGTDCPAHLRGMFAFAIVDQRHTSSAGKNWLLFLARDRLGIKPLYLWRDQNQLLFASEVRSLLASCCIPRSLSPAGLYTYLAYGSVQEPLTLIDGITSLAPATWMAVEGGAERPTVTQACYWQPPDGEATEPAPPMVLEWSADAVGSHLVSDVPLGAFLSGGLDSGTIVALGSRALTQPMRTFTLTFDDGPGDERALADLTARRCRTDHQSYVITAKGLLADLPLAIADMDQPTMDGVNSWFVSREARRAGLTVALAGVGGDEIFAGYPSFGQAPRLKNLPGPWPWLTKLPGWQDGWNWLPGNPDTRRKFAAYMAAEMPCAHPYFAIRGLLTSRQIRRLGSDSLFQQLQENPGALQTWQHTVAAETSMAGRYDPISEVSWLELSQYMRSTLLRDTDMMSMAHSLEVRVPFVDHVLVENILRVKGALKWNGNQTKPLLARALRDYLPYEVSSGIKRTFTFPFEQWMHNELAAVVEGGLRHISDGLCPWVNSQAVAGLWVDFQSGRTNWARPWALYVLDSWVARNL